MRVLEAYAFYSAVALGTGATFVIPLWDGVKVRWDTTFRGGDRNGQESLRFLPRLNTTRGGWVKKYYIAEGLYIRYANVHVK